MSGTDELAGIIGEIEQESTAHDPVEQEEVSTTATAEGSEASETEETKTQKTNTEDAETQETGTTDEGTTETDATSTETDAHSKTETDTDAVAEDFNFEATLPPPPQGYTGKVPEIDPETGQITNMNPVEYATYMRESTKAEMKLEGYNNFVEHAALDAAEKILPDIKTNPAVRTLVENARIAGLYNGQMLNSFEAAKLVRDALGITPAKIADAKAQGAQNAKVSIEVQKNASLETSSSSKGNPTADKVTTLQKRVKRGDDEAFVELLDLWEKDGKV